MKKRVLVKWTAMVFFSALMFVACQDRQFKIEGTITKAKDSMLYLEHLGLAGVNVVDSVKLNDDGHFVFENKADSAPEFYRLRVGQQYINLSVDSTETLKVRADYPTMAQTYEVEGSQNCLKIKELVLLQIKLQNKIDAIVASPSLSVVAVEDSVDREIQHYKDYVKKNYIFKEPMKAYSYYALFQTVRVGQSNGLIFNPRNSKEDVKVFAAVATSWDTFFPGSERGLNLHNIALEGINTIRLMEHRNAKTIDASQVEETGLLNIALPDASGKVRNLTDLKGKVVLLDFCLYGAPQSTQRIMMMRDLYNKYHNQGLEIYQVGIDPEEHFWKTKTAALPWICVWDENGTNSNVLALYNVTDVPTYFLIDKNNVLQKRDTQVTNIEKAIEALL